MCNGVNMNNLIKEFMKIANRDLKSSKILYEHHLYPQSMFYFSQSVEKANKTLALTTGKYTEEDLLNIRHDSTTIYKNSIIETKKRYKNLQRNLKEIPYLNDTELVINLNIPGLIKKCDVVLKDFAEIQTGKFDSVLFMPKREIVNRLKEICSTDKEIEEGISNIRNFKLTEQMWNDLKNDVVKQLRNPNNEKLTSLFEDEITNSNLNHEEMECMSKDFSIRLLYFYRISYPLYHLSVITLPHSVITRYPQNGLNPTTTYTRTLAIVRSLPDLFEIQSKTLVCLEKYCQEYVFS